MERALTTGTETRGPFTQIGSNGPFVAITMTTIKGVDDLLKKYDLKLPTLESVLAMMAENQELRSRLRGRFFFLAESGDTLGKYDSHKEYTFDKRTGALSPITEGMRVNRENTVEIVKLDRGSEGNQLCLVINNQTPLLDENKRFTLTGNLSETASVTAVVAVQAGEGQPA